MAGSSESHVLLLNDQDARVKKKYNGNSNLLLSSCCFRFFLKQRIVLTVAVSTIIIVYVCLSFLLNNSPLPRTVDIPGLQGYLVKNERCIIPDIDPYLYDVMKIFERHEYKPCSTSKPLTRVIYDEKTELYTLKVAKEHIRLYADSDSVDCCYQSIFRNGTGQDIDYKVWLSECIDFKDEIELTSNIDSILVKCKANGSQVYYNGHAMMPERKEVRDRINKWKSKGIKNRQSPPNVILIGIDSISRMNFIRSMPNTVKYLHENEWFELSGYNKIEDNTFPNLIAIHTGLGFESASEKCNLPVVSLDNCFNLIWDAFHDHGYVTAFAEDETNLNTFNWIRRGFIRPPVDHYLRPFLLAAEKNLPLRKSHGQIRCIAYQDYYDHIMDYAQEQVVRFKDDPYFGFFWMSSFSHENFNDPSSMDNHITERMKNFMSLEGLNNTIVIFFSDHGHRFGPVLKTLAGYYEERLPFMFIHLPTELKKSHPEFVSALKTNKHRLTNPYDLHMTLKHILSLSNRVTDQKYLAKSEDCPSCQTLFKPVPHNRSCEDIAIPTHYCTCIPYEKESKNSTIAIKLAQLTVDYLNNMVVTLQNGTHNICEHLSLSKIDSIYQANTGTKSDKFYRINFYTAPNQGLFGATVRYNKWDDDFEVVNKLSRLNLYRNDSYCVQGDDLKKYCLCKKHN